MASWWTYLIPKYGNFGGPAWSGGKSIDSYDDVDWSVSRSDSLDECFFDHDKRYQLSIEQERSGEISNKQKLKIWLKADQILVKSIDDIPINPNEWQSKPTKHSHRYAWFYRKLALGVFGAKTWLYEWRHGKIE